MDKELRVIEFFSGIGGLHWPLKPMQTDDTWLPSPPCQPYTDGGSILDDKDPRAPAIDLLGLLEQPPNYIFLENVINFDVSSTRERLLEAAGTVIDFGGVTGDLKPKGDHGKRPETVIRPFTTSWPYEDEMKYSLSLSEFFGEPMMKVFQMNIKFQMSTFCRCTNFV
ncbi:hypothetical protein BJ742DRAFT_872507 [Cladochytrium replicatum]|nr:hypothetical protein BJ742DRAFT_872507 [Cladochytrium replicatum]